jgi:hypothetical protein
MSKALDLRPLPDFTSRLAAMNSLGKATDLTQAPTTTHNLVLVVSIHKNLLTSIDAPILRNPNLMLF